MKHVLTITALVLVAGLLIFFLSRPTSRDSSGSSASLHDISTITSTQGIQVHPSESRPEPVSWGEPEFQRRLGTVLVTVTGEGRVPVPAAVVYLREGVVATTDRNGQCLLAMETRWSGRASVVADGYSYWRSEPLTCELGETVRLVVRMVKGVDLRVKVVNADGVGLADAVVEICTSVTGEGLLQSDIDASSKTDPEGVVSFKDLVSAPVFIVVRLQGHVPKREPFQLVSRGEVVEHTITLLSARRVTVHVAEVESREAVRGLRFCVRRATGFTRLVGYFTTDDRGEFIVDAPFDEELTVINEPNERCAVVSSYKFSGREERIELLVRLARDLQCIVRREDGDPVTDVIIDYWYGDGRHMAMAVTTDRGACGVRDQTTSAAPSFRISIPGYGSSAVERCPVLGSPPEPLVVVVRPATRVTGVLVDHLRQPVPFTTVRVIRVQDFTGWFRKGAFAIAEGPTDNEGRFQFELPSHETNARYAIKVMTQRATAPLVFLCRGNCDSAMPFGLGMSSSPPDVRLLPAGGESFDVGEIQCLASATVSLQVVSTGHPPPYKIWLTPAGVNQRSFSVVTGGTDGTGLATFEGLAPGAYFVEALRAPRDSPPPIGANASRNMLVFRAGDNGVIDIPYALK